MHSVIFCIFCIFALFMTAYGTILVYKNGSLTRSNGLKYQNGSLGSTTNGTVSLDMEQVWLYKYSWPYKTRVSKSYFHCLLVGQAKNQRYNMKSFKARILYDLYGQSVSAGSKVEATFHRWRAQVTAPSINYQTTLISLELIEHFVKRLGLGETFNAVYLSLSWWPVLWPVKK